MKVHALGYDTMHEEEGEEIKKKNELSKTKWN